MKVEVIKCQLNKEDGTIQGNYIIRNGDSAQLVAKNGNHYKVVKHGVGETIILHDVTQEVEDAINIASIEYLKERS